jgi:microcystin-dependent protein
METFMGTILAFAFNYAPRGWQTCSGQLLSISQNSALFALLGTTYGGNGQSTFALPDLRGRSLVGMGQGPGLSNITQGEISGTETTTLLVTNMPMHNHILVPAQVTATTAATALSGGTITNETDGGNNSFATGGAVPSIYSEPGGTANAIGGISTTISGSTSIAGGSQPFSLRNPFMGINYCICIEGIFPSRN